MLDRMEVINTGGLVKHPWHSAGSLDSHESMQIEVTDQRWLRGTNKRSGFVGHHDRIFSRPTSVRGEDTATAADNACWGHQRCPFFEPAADWLHEHSPKWAGIYDRTEVAVAEPTPQTHADMPHEQVIFGKLPPSPHLGETCELWVPGFFIGRWMGPFEPAVAADDQHRNLDNPKAGFQGLRF